MCLGCFYVDGSSSCYERGAVCENFEDDGSYSYPNDGVTGSMMILLFKLIIYIYIFFVQPVSGILLKMSVI
jgi:hypothetical protein